MARTSFNYGAENTNKLAVRFTARHLQLFAFTQNAYNTAHLHLHPRKEKCHHLYTYEISLWWFFFMFFWPCIIVQTFSNYQL